MTSHRRKVDGRIVSRRLRPRNWYFIITCVILRPTAHAFLSSNSPYTRARLPSKRYVLTTPESIIEQASTKNLLDYLIDESVRTSARRPIMMQFDPSSGWIWKRWKGTVFSETWESCVTKMIFASVVFFLCRRFPESKTLLSGFTILWGQLLSVTTFTLTFFVNQSYALWRKCYELSRRLQGRLHDLDMTLACHARRIPGSDPLDPSTYTPGSRKVLELVSRYVRLFNLLTYASFTRSHRPVLTPRGMRRLVERGLMTQIELTVLQESKAPALQKHNAVLMWIIRTFVEGCEAGHFQGSAGFEEQFLEKAHICRAQYGAIGDELHGRMPLAYTHIVQVLVDVVLWLYPFMAVSSGMSGMLCVLGTGLLTVSYQGLFDLAKQFLDPYDNESYGKGEDPLVVDTLIAETNAGSVRWMWSLEKLPVSGERIQSGDFDSSILPHKGYTVEELEVMEEEKARMELELQLQREQEEQLRLEAEEHELQVQEAAQQMRMYSDDIFLTTRTQKPVLVSDISYQIPLSNCATTINDALASDVATFVENAFALPGAVPTSLVPDQTGFTGTLKRNDVKDTAIADTEPKVNSTVNGETQTSDSTIQLLPNNVQVNGESDINGNSVWTKQLDTKGLPQSYVFSYEEYERQMLELLSQARAEWTETAEVVKPLPGSEFGTDEETTRDNENQSDPGESILDERRSFEDFISDTSSDDGELSSMTREEYEQRVSEILRKEQEELLETQAILDAPPGADSLELPEIIDEEDTSNAADVGESDEIPTQATAPATTADADTEPPRLDQWTPWKINSTSVADTIPLDASMSQDLVADLQSFEAISQVSDITIANDTVSDPEEANQDQLENLEDTATDEDAEAMAMKELLETEAIMNAPPGAEAIEMIDDDPDSLLMNSSQINELEILEMDKPTNATTTIATIEFVDEEDPDK